MTLEMKVKKEEARGDWWVFESEWRESAQRRCKVIGCRRQGRRKLDTERRLIGKLFGCCGRDLTTGS